MKKLFLLSIIFLAATAAAQIPELRFTIDLSQVSGDNLVKDNLGRSISGAGAFTAQVVFEKVCPEVTFEAGASLIDNAPAFPSSFGGWDMPIALDTAATRTDGKLMFAPYLVGGARNWNFELKMTDWHDYYIWFATDPNGCETGTIKIYY